MTRLPVTDGMRAIAVIGVVLFHSFPSLLPGGFMGVDMFFVISGFVISLVYGERLVSGAVPFLTFYVRRIRRLAPAYIAVVIVTTAACFAILPPRDLSNYAFSLAMQAFYAQNIAFWLIGDYFEAALAKPLLHTWSLAVEEQFYFVFPLLILLVRWKWRWEVAVLVASIVASLAIGWVVGGISPKTSFYWLPTRMWEFATGSLAASLYRRGWVTRRPAVYTATLGIVLILLSFAAFDGSSGFPGPQSLMAVAGTAMLLVAQDVRTTATGLLRMRWAQWTGRVSYSWYLWHWPPLSLWFLATGAAPAGATALLLAVVGLAGGAFSYYGIERRVAESSRLLKPRTAFAVVGGFAIFALACSAVVFRTDGFVRSYPPRIEKLMRAQLDVPPYRCPLGRRLAMWREPVCELNDVDRDGDGVLLIGDSHADRTKTVLIDQANVAGMPLYLVKKNCRLSDYGSRSDCTIADLNDLAASVRKLSIHKALAISHWESQPSKGDRARLAGNLAALGIQTFIQLPTPAGPMVDPVTKIAHAFNPNRTTVLTRANVVHDTVSFRSFITSLSRPRSNIVVLDPLPILCPSVCLTEDKGVYLYRDTNHLTLQGVKLLAPLYKPVFQRHRFTISTYYR